MSSAAFDSDEAFDQLMGDMQVLYHLRAGHAVSQDDVDALLRLDAHYRAEEERVTDAYHRGWQDGLKRGGSVEIQELQNALDEARMETSAERALKLIARKDVERRDELLAEAERFIRGFEDDERQEGVKALLASIRLAIGTAEAIV